MKVKLESSIDDTWVFCEDESWQREIKGSSLGFILQNDLAIKR